jgi:hypothetical protein
VVRCFPVIGGIRLRTFEESWTCLHRDGSAGVGVGPPNIGRGCCGCCHVPGPLMGPSDGPRATNRSISFIMLDVFQNNQGPMSKLRWRVRIKILYLLTSGLSCSSSLEPLGSSSRCVLVVAPIAGSQKGAVRQELYGGAKPGVGNVPLFRWTT